MTERFIGWATIILLHTNFRGSCLLKEAYKLSANRLETGSDRMKSQTCTHSLKNTLATRADFLLTTSSPPVGKDVPSLPSIFSVLTHSPLFTHHYFSRCVDSENALLRNRNRALWCVTYCWLELQRCRSFRFKPKAANSERSKGMTCDFRLKKGSATREIFLAYPRRQFVPSLRITGEAFSV